jgi:hypothetical protein
MFILIVLTLRTADHVIDAWCAVPCWSYAGILSIWRKQASEKLADENFIHISWIAAKVPTCAFLHVMRRRTKKASFSPRGNSKGNQQ